MMTTTLPDVQLDLAFNQGRSYVQGVTLLTEAVRQFSKVTGQDYVATGWTLAAQFKRELTVNARMLHFTSMQDASLWVAHGGVAIFDFKSAHACHVFVVVEDKNRPVTRKTDIDLFGASTLDPVESAEGWQLNIQVDTWLPLVFYIARAQILLLQKENEHAGTARWAFFDPIPLEEWASPSQTRIVFCKPRILPSRTGYFDYRQVRIEQEGMQRYISNAVMVYNKA